MIKGRHNSTYHEPGTFAVTKTSNFTFESLELDKLNRKKLKPNRHRVFNQTLNNQDFRDLAVKT